MKAKKVYENIGNVLKPKTTAEIIGDLEIADKDLEQYLIDNNFVFLGGDTANHGYSMASPPENYYWFEDSKGHMVQVTRLESLEDFLEYYNPNSTFVSPY